MPSGCRCLPIDSSPPPPPPPAAERNGSCFERTGGFRTGLAQVQGQKLGLGEKPDWINVRGMVTGFLDKEDAEGRARTL
eukprot:gene5784-43693_t